MLERQSTTHSPEHQRLGRARRNARSRGDPLQRHARDHAGVEVLSDNGLPYNARETHILLGNLGSSPASRLSAARTQRHLGGLRAHPQMQLRPRPAAARCIRRVDITCRMDRGLQRQPPTFTAQNAFAARASRNGFCNCLKSSGETGARSAAAGHNASIPTNLTMG